MEDEKIVSLCWQRDETAISAMQEKYERYCYTVAYNILASHEDAQECVNDTYCRAWESIPPHRPQMLRVFLGKITRNAALDRRKNDTAAKRGGGTVALALEELQDCIPARASHTVDELMLRDALNRFLHTLPRETARVFLRRYWYVSAVKEIAADYGMSESKVKTLLFRTRNSLKLFLEKEGIDL